MKKQSMRGGLALLLCAALCLAMMIGGCAKQPEAPSGSAAVPEASEKVPELGEEELEHMLPILEGIAVAAEGGKTYDSQNAEQVWQMLYSVAYRNGEQLWEVDKRKMKYVIPGVDYMAEVRKALGK